MNTSLVLETEGYVVIFRLEATRKEYADSRSLVRLVLEFQTRSAISTINVSSIETYATEVELRRLVEYLHAHILCLQHNPAAESETYISTETGFQLQAGTGEVVNSEDGAFTLRVMLNIGQLDRDSASTYVGGETLVTVRQINAFSRALLVALRRVFSE